MIKLPRIPDHLNAQWPYLPHQLRARDLEVARVVLEAVAKVLEENATQCSLQLETFVLLCNAVSIRALEVTHD